MQQTFEAPFRHLELPDVRERVDQPERGEEEGTFLATQPVLALVRPVAIDEHALAEMLCDGANRRMNSWVAVGEKAHLGDAQHRRVERIAVELLGEGPTMLRISARGDRAMDDQSRAPPGDLVVREVVAIGNADAAVDGDTAHHLAVRVLAALAAHLPDGGVGLRPAFDGDLDDVAELFPERLADLAPESREDVGTVEHLAVDVELQLVDGGVADAHGTRAPVASEVVEDVLRRMCVPVQLEEVGDVRRFTTGEMAMRQPVEVRGGLIGEPELKERVERERGIAQP